MKRWESIVVPFLLGLAAGVGFMGTAELVRPGTIGNIIAELHRWQTLFAAIVALVAAQIAWHAAIRKITADRKATKRQRRRDRRAMERLADRTIGNGYTDCIAFIAAVDICKPSDLSVPIALYTTAIHRLTLFAELPWRDIVVLGEKRATMLIAIGDYAKRICAQLEHADQLAGRLPLAGPDEITRLMRLNQRLADVRGDVNFLVRNMIAPLIDEDGRTARKSFTEQYEIEKARFGPHEPHE